MIKSTQKRIYISKEDSDWMKVEIKDLTNKIQLRVSQQYLFNRMSEFIKKHKNEWNNFK